MMLGRVIGCLGASHSHFMSFCFFIPLTVFIMNKGCRMRRLQVQGF